MLCFYYFNLIMFPNNWLACKLSFKIYSDSRTNISSKIYLSVCIYCYFVTLLDTKSFLAELNDDQEFLSNEYSGRVTEPNKEIEKEDNSSLVQIETGSDYVDIEYDVADYDD